MLEADEGMKLRCVQTLTLILGRLSWLAWEAMYSEKSRSMYSITRNSRLLSQMTSFSLRQGGAQQQDTTDAGCCRLPRCPQWLMCT